jgi:hypothetical protein
MEKSGVPLSGPTGAEDALRKLRSTYEPFLEGLARRLLLTVPPLISEGDAPDNWQRSAWMKPAPGIGALPGAQAGDQHFDG